MKKKTQQLPHNSRIIPAFIRRSLLDRRSSNEGGGEGGPFVAKTVVLAAVAAFLALNLFGRLPDNFTKARQAKLAVMLSPNDVSNHLLLVQEYLSQGNMPAVERELLLSESLNTKYQILNTNSVLGASLSPLKILEKIKAQPAMINQEISFWEKVAAEKPDYRDGYLRLALLNYQIYETQKAKAYLEKAKTLDPNFEAVKELGKILK